MKNLKKIIYFFCLSIAFTACDLADPIESEITEYAEFEVNEGPYVYWQLGTPFEDPGVIATAGEDELEVSVAGTVDVNTPGVYVLTYSAVNADGFSATTNRFVAVGNQEIAFNRDLSGVYTVGIRTNTVTRIQPGFYQNSDVLPPNVISVFMVDLGTGELVIPSQPSRFGSVSADPAVSEGSYGRLDTETSFTLSLKIGGNPLFVRNFTKQ